VPNVGATYIGRFAPSPTGPLHAGSLVAALASWLDARAHRGRWLIRVEDVDTPRCIDGMGQIMLAQLQPLGLLPDEAPVFQSQRTSLYQRALDQLVAHGLAYPCHCSRKAVETALIALGRPRPRHGELIYPGTCRHAALQPDAGNPVPGFTWRLRTDIGWSNRPLALADTAYLATNIIATTMLGTVDWIDRRLGPQQQQVETTVGDFPLKRPDGCFTYQLAAVVDDAAQGITHVVRGEDLADNTARQILLQSALGLPTPEYLHTPLVLGANGEKLSKQNGARTLDSADPLAALNAAAAVLGMTAIAAPATVAHALAVWVAEWGHLYNPDRD
jgi:glutamyl-Q tRNA(Asp) synthetase